VAFIVVLAFIIEITFGSLDFRLKKDGYTLDTLPKVSVIIPARNEEDVIARCIENLKTQDYPRDKLEILVVNDESTDKTMEIALERLHDGGVSGKVIDLGPKDGTTGLTGRLRAVDAGIRQASSDICICLDGDSYPETNQYIRSFVKRFTDPKIGLLSGPTTVSKKEFGAYTLQRAFWFFFKGICRLIKAHMGGNSCIRKSVYEKVGGYQTGVRVMAFAAIDSRLKKNGYRIVNFSSPTCRIVKEPVTTRKELMEMLRRWYKYGTVKENKTGLYVWIGGIAFSMSYLLFMALIQWFLPYQLYAFYLILAIILLAHICTLIVAFILDRRHCLSGTMVWAPLALGCLAFLQNRKGKNADVWKGRQLA
jgi:cellulose synthase/poly-beta-1,6-N-acetylglucosamine synthase-like glycosyltransferase